MLGHKPHLFLCSTCCFAIQSITASPSRQASPRDGEKRPSRHPLDTSVGSIGISASVGSSAGGGRTEFPQAFHLIPPWFPCSFLFETNQKGDQLKQVPQKTAPCPRKAHVPGAGIFGGPIEDATLLPSPARAMDKTMTGETRQGEVQRLQALPSQIVSSVHNRGTE